MNVTAADIQKLETSIPEWDNTRLVMTLRSVSAEIGKADDMDSRDLLVQAETMLSDEILKRLHG